mmetsp:Transcript_58965/g.165416  ORF Transcript_58965/g.165416 Transcript_58965/m.165416 type:complete len:202 (+) Transcript_58965:67-672(+)
MRRRPRCAPGRGCRAAARPPACPRAPSPTKPAWARTRTPPASPRRPGARAPYMLPAACRAGGGTPPSATAHRAATSSAGRCAPEALGSSRRAPLSTRPTRPANLWQPAPPPVAAPSLHAHAESSPLCKHQLCSASSSSPSVPPRRRRSLRLRQVERRWARDASSRASETRRLRPKGSAAAWSCKRTRRSSKTPRKGSVAAL